MMQISGHLYEKLLECARDHRPMVGAWHGLEGWCLVRARRVGAWYVPERLVPGMGWKCCETGTMGLGPTFARG